MKSSHVYGAHPEMLFATTSAAYHGMGERSTGGGGASGGTAGADAGGGAGGAMRSDRSHAPRRPHPHARGMAAAVPLAPAPGPATVGSGHGVSVHGSFHWMNGVLEGAGLGAAPPASSIMNIPALSLGLSTSATTSAGRGESMKVSSGEQMTSVCFNQPFNPYARPGLEPSLSPCSTESIASALGPPRF